MSDKLQFLLEQLTPAERSGAVLSVRAPLPRHTRSPKDLRDEVRDVIATKAVSEALVRARKQAGLKAKDVAAALEVSAPRVAQIEAQGANLMLSTLLEHAAATGCDVEIILRPRDPKLPLVTAPLLHSSRSGTAR